MSVLAVLERSPERWHRMSWETLAAAQRIAAAGSFPVKAAVVGDAAELTNCQLHAAISIRHDLLSTYSAGAWTAALASLIERENPSLVLFPHTYQVRDFAPKLAARLGRSLISDVIKVKDGVFTRQLFQGKLNADYRPAPGIVLASLQAGAWSPESVIHGKAPLEIFEPALDPSNVTAQSEPPFRESARAVDLTAAEKIVSIGRGIQDRDNIRLVEDLARALGAELAASRPICDNGWLPMERQVGSSGQTVAPKLYLAIGISGAIQHIVGMKGAKTIVAVNKDPNAPIFEIADYGIAADLFEVVPALIDALRKAQT
jgi:electron transfer flavoprotein alpha subunit